MAPIKFEEQLKDKLEQRTVSPSADAWSKLSQRLDVEDKRSKKSSFWWLSIAASVAALVFVTIAYFGKEDETSINNTIVKEEIKDLKSTNQKEDLLTPNKALNKAIVTSDLIVKKKNIVKEEPETSLDKKKQKETIVVDKVFKTPTVNDVAEVKKAPRIDEEIINNVNGNLILEQNAEFNSVVAELQKIKSKNKTMVTDQQIDSLLKVASRELLMDRMLKKNSNNVVDADALLRYAEDDLGQSFRTRIYEALKNSFNGVKTAVANRNN